MLRKHSPVRKDEKTKESPGRPQEKLARKNDTTEDRYTTSSENERSRKEKRHAVVKKDSRDLRRGIDKPPRRESPAAERAKQEKNKNEILEKEMFDEGRNIGEIRTKSGNFASKQIKPEDRPHSEKALEKTMKKENAKTADEKTTTERMRVGVGKGRAAERIEIYLPLEERRLLEEAKRIEEKVMQDDLSESTDNWPEQDKVVAVSKEEKSTKKWMLARRKSRDDGGQASGTGSPVETPTLEAHVEAIRERRMSLPRTITSDPTADVEILIGEDGKPVFHPTITPKAEEILRELTDIVLADEERDERMPKFIPS